jgi:hypothetical protein
MSILNPTPPERMVDSRGRPYFLWDVDLTLQEFRQKLADPDADVRACFLGRLMRQAKPDDVFSFTSVAAIEAQWERVSPYLGRTREFWRWLLDTWKARSDAGR